MTGRSVTRVSLIQDRRRASRSAANTSIASFASSDGWMLKMPMPIQRDEPFTFWPMPGNRTTTSRSAADRHQRDGELAPSAVVEPQRDEEHDRTDEEPEQLALEVVVRRTLVLQRGDRRRGQHHHETDEVQDDDDREQQHVARRRPRRGRPRRRRPRLGPCPSLGVHREAPIRSRTRAAKSSPRSP